MEQPHRSLAVLIDTHREILHADLDAKDPEALAKHLQTFAETILAVRQALVPQLRSANANVR